MYMTINIASPKWDRFLHCHPHAYCRRNSTSDHKRRVESRRKEFLGLVDDIMGILAITSSVFHKIPYEALIFRLGIVYNIWGVYFLLRCFCPVSGRCC